MRFDIMTLFPELCDTILAESIIGRARKADLVEVHCHNIRDYSKDKFRRVDDTPYGGGKGMLMKPDPICDCYDAITDGEAEKPYTVYMSPKGALFTQKKAKELSEKERIVILCGHYEGVDQRAIDAIVDEEISIGDYVLTGGELPACVLADAVSRLVPGVLASPECYEKESLTDGLLEYPQYTRPFEFRGETVPEVLISGHHEKIEAWRTEMARKLTKEKRPDLLDGSEKGT
ncbi:MAG: tRNA (guanosine(37)-N1)-methyltransferase TrmD [Ruminococcaceae bacterium]|nr:tRNA (guanosine(37)-N1)-methyltransferase TrmD [Oscillospiraceae bacterium]